jgi:hypothetical protein
MIEVNKVMAAHRDWSRKSVTLNLSRLAWASPANAEIVRRFRALNRRRRVQSLERKTSPKLTQLA